MIITCSECSGRLFKIDIVDSTEKGKKKVIILCDNCGYSIGYVIEGEEIPKRD